ncbi:AAA family ATPase [Draconibacterium sp. IB214405]|uniref:AAA family ATPase n=1 Tax=Draconibacterium sp. IB214405 TaxID=3097352 RepID=UPI002A0B37E7|nr:AAA family ATPase [Draconibacterium sp. IB214405]MDX8338778.1 AAA family ATPase [Draconibacterium sp. IB214405]
MEKEGSHYGSPFLFDQNLLNMELRQAQRKQAKIKLALQGPSGSGKTMSALLLASGITDWNKIAVIDTENHSADLYAHLGDYNVLQLSKPFTPERYITAIETCENSSIEVIIVDSVSHEWEGAGGVLSIHSAMAGNSFTNWSKITPRHNAFVQKMLDSPCHIIATIRSKQDYTLTEKNGKMVPEKVGLKGVTREGMDYEFTVVFDLDISHHAKASKDRTGLFMDKPEGIISAGYGIRILKWCNTGTSLNNIKSDISNAKSLDELRNILRLYPEHKDVLNPLAIARKEELSKSIINPTNFSENGRNTSKDN